MIEIVSSLFIGYFGTAIIVYITLISFVFLGRFNITYRTGDMILDQLIELLNANPVRASVAVSMLWLGWLILYIFEER